MSFTNTFYFLIRIRHEIVGEVVRVGNNVADKSIEIGRRAGVGAQAGADYSCDNCKEGKENYCVDPIGTYVSPTFVAIILVNPV